MRSFINFGQSDLGVWAGIGYHICNHICTQACMGRGFHEPEDDGTMMRDEVRKGGCMITYTGFPALS